MTGLALLDRHDPPMVDGPSVDYLATVALRSEVVLIASASFDWHTYSRRMTNVDSPHLVLAAAGAGLLFATLFAALTLFNGGGGIDRAVWLSVATAPVAAVG